MKIDDFMEALLACVKEEFVATIEKNENTIRVIFLNGQVVKMVVSEDMPQSL